MSVGLSGFRSSVENKKIVCYGAGVNAQHMLYNEKFAEFLPRVSFFVDMDIKKTGTYIKTNGFQFEIFNVDALKNINISFNDKGLVSIVGASGCGKTT